MMQHHKYAPPGAMPGVLHGLEPATEHTQPELLQDEALPGAMQKAGLNWSRHTDDA